MARMREDGVIEVYDIATDEFRPITLADINGFETLAARIGPLMQKLWQDYQKIRDEVITEFNK